MISIIGGKYKKTKLEVPIAKIRPTSSIKREAILGGNLYCRHSL